jgi:transketolase
MQAAAQFELANLVCIVDRNKLQMTGFTEELMAQRDLCAKATAFGWDTMEIADGNDVAQVCAALEKLPERDYARRGAPLFIVSNTVKGKGVSFMENQVGWHGKAPNAEQREQALKELED